MKGLCPFHEEKTPSFSVDPSRQLFYCFGCQTGGDLFKFVMLYEKVSFPEAAEMLAKRWGVPLPAPTGRKRDGLFERLLEMNRSAEAFFKTTLAGAAGAGCRDYLAKRRIDEATTERLGLGYAPEGWETLRTHLVAKRFKPEEILRAGLVLPRKSGSGHYDRFRDRLVFPIRNVNGQTVAFGGRALGKEAQPKYLNSPETPTYKKGEHLYGLDLAKEAIRREGLVIVVEGYLDLAALVQAGFEQTVASLGTAFTEAQARLLARYTDRVVFSYDGDGAGAAATTRSLDLLLSKGFEVRVVELPEGQDPDDYIGSRSAEAYGQLLRQAPDYLQFLIGRESRTRDLGKIGEKVAAINAVLPHIARLRSPVERASWAGKLADALQVEDGLVLQELRSAVRSARVQIRQRPVSERKLRDAEARLVSQLLRSEEEQERLEAGFDPVDLQGTEVLPVVQAIVGLRREGKPVDYPSVLDALQEEADRDLLTRIAFRDEPDEGPNVEDCLWAFKRQRLAREKRKVRREIGELQQTQGQISTAELDRRLMHLQQLARQRDAIS